MAILDRIKFDGLRSGDWLVYKYPTEEIKMFSSLIVRDGQIAIFIKSGLVCDSFLPGTYELDTLNLPIISKLINLPYGGKTPFAAEIYFINTITKLDITWGTTDPIQIIDPKYFIKLRIRAFGQMGLKLKDHSLFFKELIGGMGQNDIVKFDKIKLFYRGLIVIKVKTIIADTIINNGISALQISTKLEEISQKAKNQIEMEFVKYGFTVPTFYIESINFPDKDFEQINSILSDKAAFEIMGDQHYTSKRSFDVYEGAAKNESGVAGAMLAGGIGLGAGINMASNMNQILSPPHAQVNQTKHCSSCNTVISDGQKFCNNCGISIESKKLKCPKCGNGISFGKFCNSCGVRLIHTCECGSTLDVGINFCPTCGKKVDI